MVQMCTFATYNWTDKQIQTLLRQYQDNPQDNHHACDRLHF